MHIAEWVDRMQPASTNDEPADRLLQLLKGRHTKESVAELVQILHGVLKNQSQDVPGPTKEALNEFLQLQHATRLHEYYEHQLADMALSYEAHCRQMTLLMWAHAPVVLLILIFAAVGGHVHTVQTVFCVYLGLFVSFVVAVVALGIQTKRAWIPRAFSLSLMALSIWSLVCVIYAIYSQPRMRLWNDITLLCLNGVDFVITIMYFYTAEMTACVGGEASALVNTMHFDHVMISPIASNIGDAATANYRATRPSALKTIIAGVSGLFNGDPHVRRKLA